ncbi:LacI family DNA-binding transcriptional regulator [Proteinivorax hydrogeniformans]|uniref:LacI family DNA-binding transcriptional regulator n=1 Tax=Proteinivorax hydrogeniformans TaxID=1826727 RepID=A0AAU8HVG6_9FIRM
MNKKVVTINDVAKKAGVSPSTVSRVISKNPKISAPTREKVLRHMEEMGYHPNAIARSLASKKSGAIGVIMPTTSQDLFLNPFFPEALRGIVRGASNSGYDLLLSTNSDKDEEIEVIKHFILGSKVDGIILMSSKVNDECVNYLSSLDFPFSLIGSPDGLEGQINHVDNDNFMAAYEVTTYLSMKGKKKIAMIVGDEKLIVTKKRVEGYKRALLESNINFDENLLYTGSFDEQTGYEYGSIIAEMEDKPDAVIVADDLVAYGAVKVFESLDVSIPEDIAVASFNNSILSRYAATPITSVDINAVKLGEESMKLVVQAMEKEVRGQKIITPYTIHKRKSTEG